MVGAIAGDVIGYFYEHDPIKTSDFLLFGSTDSITDDTNTNMTIGVADAIPQNGDYRLHIQQFIIKRSTIL